MLTDIVLFGVIGCALPVVLAPRPFSALLRLRYPSGATAENLWGRDDGGHA